MDHVGASHKRAKRSVEAVDSTASRAPALGYIPDALKLLARKVARAFYNDVAVVVMDMLARHTCVKEEDIRDTLQLQAKVVKMALASLETDRLVKQIDFDDPSVSIEERKRKAKYWFVDYEALVCVVKYKLDRIWHRINNDAKQKLSSTVSECPECLTHFSDMDLCELFDEATGQFQCRYCKVELVQKVDHAAAELNSVMTKMNTQTRVFTELLQQVDEFVISERILKPKPSHLTVARMRASELNVSRALPKNAQSKVHAQFYQSANPFEETYSIRIVPPGTKRKKYKPQPAWTRGTTVVLDPLGGSSNGIQPLSYEDQEQEEEEEEEDEGAGAEGEAGAGGGRGGAGGVGGGGRGRATSVAGDGLVHDRFWEVVDVEPTQETLQLISDESSDDDDDDGCGDDGHAGRGGEDGGDGKDRVGRAGSGRSGAARDANNRDDDDGGGNTEERGDDEDDEEEGEEEEEEEDDAGGESDIAGTQ